MKWSLQQDALYFIQEIREELGIDSYICFNGQYVVRDNEVIYRNPIEKDSGTFNEYGYAPRASACIYGRGVNEIYD